MNLKRLACTGVLLTAIPLFTNGCGADDLCCTDFEVGADLSGVEFGLEGQLEGQFKAFAQASGDLAAVASGALNDVLLSCENMARDLGATDEAVAEANNNEDEGARVKAVCALATAQINAGLTISGSAKASLEINFEPPKCEASVKASMDCQAGCSVEGGCDVEANPPTCEGGTMTLSCEGSCKGEVNAAIDCKGSCDVAAEGSCSFEGGVDCQGKCEGTCEGKAGVGEGTTTDGRCEGTCKGTCSAVAPKAECKGSFEGKCEGSCKATAGAKVECSAGCEGKAEPLKCSGGELKASCEVSADCKASCDGSVSAKAECRPPSLDIRIKAAAGLEGNVEAQAKIGAVINTLKVNLPNILVVVQARGQALVELSGSVVASGKAVFKPGDLNVKAGACLIPILGAIEGAVSTLPATLEASGSVVASVGL